MAERLQRADVHGCVLARVPQDRLDASHQDVPAQGAQVRQVNNFIAIAP